MQNLIAQIDLRETLFSGAGNPHPAGQEFNSATDILSTLLPNLYLIAGIILFLYLVFGGFKLIVSNGDPKSTEEGKVALTNAIIGFLIIFTSFWIIQIIQVVTGIPILNANI